MKHGTRCWIVVNENRHKCIVDDIVPNLMGGGDLYVVYIQALDRYITCPPEALTAIKNPKITRK